MRGVRDAAATDRPGAKDPQLVGNPRGWRPAPGPRRGRWATAAAPMAPMADAGPARGSKNRVFIEWPLRPEGPP